MKSSGVAAVAVLLCFSFLAEATLPSSEVSALEDLYEASGGENWLNSDNWLQGDPCANEWFGVTCDSRGQHVIYL